MSSEKSSGRLLIIEMDTRLVETLCQHFQVEGYEIHSAATCQEGISLAQTARPNLILLATRMPEMSGLDALRVLRDKPRTGHIPVMMLAGRQEMILQNKLLEEGAYDFIEKPLDLDILTLLVRNALRRAEREGLTEPRTGLPTGRLIQERTQVLEDELGWYRIDLTIADFNVFRDLYGFVTANEALRFAGNLIAQIVNEHGSSDDFVGHVTGSEDFVIVTTQAGGPDLSDALTKRVTQELESFYNFMERDQGYVEVEDGAGGKARKQLMSAKVTISQGKPDPDAPTHQKKAGPVHDPWVDAVDESSTKPDDESPGSAFSW